MGVEDLSDSKEMLGRALMLREECNGKDHVEVARVLNNLGRIFGYLGDPIRQKELLKRALKIYETHYVVDHFEVAMTLMSQTREVLARSVHIKERHYGEDQLGGGVRVGEPRCNAYIRARRLRRGEGSSTSAA